MSKDSAIKVAEAELNQARTTLAMFDIRTKIPGIVKEILKNDGEYDKGLDPVVVKIHNTESAFTLKGKISPAVCLYSLHPGMRGCGRADLHASFGPNKTIHRPLGRHNVRGGKQGSDESVYRFRLRRRHRHRLGSVKAKCLSHLSPPGAGPRRGMHAARQCDKPLSDGRFGGQSLALRSRPLFGPAHSRAGLPTS